MEIVPSMERLQEAVAVAPATVGIIRIHPPVVMEVRAAVLQKMVLDLHRLRFQQAVPPRKIFQQGLMPSMDSKGVIQEI